MLGLRIRGRLCTHVWRSWCQSVSTSVDSANQARATLSKHSSLHAESIFVALRSWRASLVLLCRDKRRRWVGDFTTALFLAQLTPCHFAGHPEKSQQTLSHVDSEGHLSMVDVGSKPNSRVRPLNCYAILNETSADSNRDSSVLPWRQLAWSSARLRSTKWLRTKQTRRVSACTMGLILRHLKCMWYGRVTCW